MLKRGKTYSSVDEIGQAQTYTATQVNIRKSVLVILTAENRSTIAIAGDIGPVQHLGVSFSKYSVSVSEIEMLNEVIDDIEESLCEIE
jgi:hypothetical protein